MTELFNKQSHLSIRKKLRNSPTSVESILWNRLKKYQLGYKFRRQVSIGRYVVDFYCVEKKLIVEIDGGYHREREVILYDEVRDTFLESLGLNILHFTNQDIMNDIEKTVSTIKVNLES